MCHCSTMHVMWLSHCQQCCGLMYCSTSRPTMCTRVPAKRTPTQCRRLHKGTISLARDSVVMAGLVPSHKPRTAKPVVHRLCPVSNLRRYWIGALQQRGCVQLFAVGPAVAAGQCVTGVYLDTFASWPTAPLLPHLSNPAPRGADSAFSCTNCAAVGAPRRSQHPGKAPFLAAWCHAYVTLTHSRPLVAVEADPATRLCNGDRRFYVSLSRCLVNVSPSAPA